MRGEIMKGEVCFKGMRQNPPLYTTNVSAVFFYTDSSYD